MRHRRVLTLSRNRGRVAAVFRKAVAVVLLVMVVGNIYFDNTCYLKAEMEQQQAISSMTVLVSRIKSVEGYKDTLPVCFVFTGKQDKTMPAGDDFFDVDLVSFDKIIPHHNRRNLRNILEHWCAFKPKYVNQKNFKNLDEVKAMPDYPDDGSIRIIDDTVVIKW